MIVNTADILKIGMMAEPDITLANIYVSELVRCLVA
jgi:hypothetical protein